MEGGYIDLNTTTHKRERKEKETLRVIRSPLLSIPYSIREKALNTIYMYRSSFSLTASKNRIRKKNCAGCYFSARHLFSAFVFCVPSVCVCVCGATNFFFGSPFFFGLLNGSRERKKKEKYNSMTIVTFVQFCFCYTILPIFFFLLRGKDFFCIF
jgi:hypothetical protein